MKKPPIIWTNVLFFSLTFLAAITLVPWYGFSYGYTSTQWIAFVGCMFYAGLSITAGYHRLWAHKAYDVHPVIEVFFALGGAFALQNSALHWSSDHRIHHGQVDDPIKDPYAATNGFWYSHIGWMLRDYQGEQYGNYSNCRDLQKNKVVSLVNDLSFPLVLKGLGFEHKTESEAVILNITSVEDLNTALKKMPECPQGYLIEEMAEKPVAELILGITRDELGLFLMTIGAGGIYTEILADTVSLLLPTSRTEILSSIKKLKINKILEGYRGQAAASNEAIIDAVLAVSAFVESQQSSLVELDINPLFAGQNRAIAVDALIRLKQE